MILFIFVPYYVLSLPMRNWNSSQASVITKALSRFEPTYEELKHPFNSLIGFFYSCFEPTYEELKLPLHFTWLGSPIRFEPTYEELKLHVKKKGYDVFLEFWAYLWGIETIWRLFTLPLGREFWAYLWGIETIIPCVCSCIFHGVLSLPMRNWNITSSSVLTIFLIGFEPTYEELKQDKTFDRTSHTFEFWAYLWGIETLLYTKSFLSSFLVLSLPMRNWNSYSWWERKF